MAEFVLNMAAFVGFLAAFVSAVAAIRARPIRPQLAERHCDLWRETTKSAEALDRFFGAMKTVVEQGRSVGADGCATPSFRAAVANVADAFSAIHSTVRHTDFVELSRAEETAGRSNLWTMIAVALAAGALVLQVAARLLR